MNHCLGQKILQSTSGSSLAISSIALQPASSPCSQPRRLAISPIALQLTSSPCCWPHHLAVVNIVPSNAPYFQGKTAVRRTSERSERRGRNLWSPWTITSFWSLSDCMSNCFVKTSVAPQFDYKNVSCTLRRKPACKDK